MRFIKELVDVQDVYTNFDIQVKIAAQFESEKGITVIRLLFFPIDRLRASEDDALRSGWRSI